ncbi:retromer complex subunit Vps35 [Coemansia sp. RSA 2703]|nr:retromer complex subunit Vps35 [Coemansia sp. RSA 2703]KAJ2379272.1 retromer complex subunit Vps35 [Coemansia sp. RSA 2607]KAJ2397969.1 retromer complex subunit Vps35 [Coemansia sp. RSA 2603]
MSLAFTGARDEQSKLLDDALQAVKVQAFQMKRCVDNDRLMDGLKHCSTMLNELRTSSLTPKNYYELYLATFDAMQYLTGALRAAHLSGRHHLDELYQLVQYAGNIVPRLYLMITIGSAYMSLAGTPTDSKRDSSVENSSTSASSDEVIPVREVMMDMLEMARGVQHPTRGLFLRYYLEQMTKDYLPLAETGGDGPEGNLEDSTHFILTNFVEMNKLWVRLQHQGLSKDKERREAERRDLRTLVGSNLLRLASLNGVPRETYEEVILPKLLSQVVSCRDTLAQEYLMEALVQAFSDEWHLATIGQLMEAISALGPKVSIKNIVIPLVDRISAYAARRREEMEKSQSAGSASPSPSSKQSSPKAENDLGSKDTAESNGIEETKSAPESEEQVSSDTIDRETEEADVDQHRDADAREIEQDVADISLSHDEQLAEEGTDSDVEADTCNSVENLQTNSEEGEDDDAEDSGDTGAINSGVTIPKELGTLINLFDSFWSHVGNLIEARPDLPLHDAIAICASMLRLSLSCNPQPTAPVDTVLAFVRALPRARQISPNAFSPAAVNQLLSLLLGPLRAYASPLKVLELSNYGPLLEVQSERTRKGVAVALLTAILQRNTIMTTKEEVSGITRLCASLISKPGNTQQQQQQQLQQSGYGDTSGADTSGNQRSSAYYGTGASSEQAYASSPLDEDDLAEEQGLLARLVHLIRGPDVVSQLSLLTIVRDAFSQGGDLVRYTYPAVVAGAVRLIGSIASMKPVSQDDPEHAEWLRRARQQCRFIQATVSVLIERSSESLHTAELALQLFLMAAQAVSVSSAFRDEPAIEEAAYEFIVQAFTIYEEHINESRAQYQALILVINALHASRNFSPENYETLVSKCVQHGSRLLKRADQTRIAYSCAQLWWKTLPYSELIPPPAEPGQDESEVERIHEQRVEREKPAVERHNNGDKVLHHLQRSLKVADSCMDPVLSVRLFVELLNQSTMHYERRCLAVTPKYINDLIDLIRTSIANMEAFDSSAPEQTRAAADSGVADVNALYTPETPMNTYVLGYFQRTLDYIQSRKELAASGLYNLPDFSAIHCDEPEEERDDFF